MSGSVKGLEPAFQGAGQKAGTEIWRIENFQPVPLPKSDHGKFYSGDSYIVLQITAGKGGAYLYDIHFWIGKDTSQDEAGTAAIKTVELDATLGGRAVQHREIQGHESDKFLSYFKPCIIPLEGGVATGFKKPEEEEFETRLYICKGKRVVRLKQVPFARSTLNHDDVFILDTKDKIYQFNGENSNIQERAKALEVIQFLKDKYHEGKCGVAIIDDGNLQAEPDSGEFWVLFGGFAPIGKKVTTEDDIVPERTPAKLFSITNGQVNPVDGELSKSILENNRCYLLDCGAEVFVWVGRLTQLDEKKAAIQTSEEFVGSQKRPKSTHITQLIQGNETNSFKAKFDSWPSGSSAPAPEEGRGKVAALLKQQGVGIKAASKTVTVNEEVPPLLEGGGKLEVWRINGSAKTPVPKDDVGKFYSGDCYIVLYTYPSNDKKEDYYLCWWIGKDSVEEDQKMASRLATTMCNSLKGRPVLGRIFQGKEPPQFVAIFQPMVVLKGGLSSGYKNYISDKGLNDETYTADSVALIRISGTSEHNNKAVQVDAVATSLNSNECFLAQSGSSMFTWHGNQSTYEQQQLASKIAEFLKPGVAAKHTKEGTESSAFWFAIGGKQSYTSKKVAPEAVRDPHLFTYSINKGKFEVEEVYNFSQDDLLTEDVLVLDTRAEVFVWVGQSTDPNEKQNAFEIGQKYIEMATCLEGLSSNAPLYKVTEGNEPCFFTTYFSWDPAKAIALGNSFQKKVTLLFGTGQGAENHPRSNGTNRTGPTQRASALAALNSAFSSSSASKPVATSRPAARSPRSSSQRAAAVAALSSVLTAENKQSTDTSPTRSPTPRSPARSSKSPLTQREASPTAVNENEKTYSPFEDPKGSPVVKETEVVKPVAVANGEGCELKTQQEQDDNNSEGSPTIFSYERLKVKSANPVTGIDFKRREAYLSDGEFEAVLGMKKEAFYKIPKWKQDMQKKKADLF
ncbi:PREDICTED: villin-2-like [Ipomoea nil]|uniref:villin-2-like n=1 Tax=Ipomoea nil TaxID=35883 RepID=UPI000901C498|nr:PREDICTED: villin-2-like [Ipomoea nil]XP_019166091.1 PREDICTED: villin-2-like [Ipomoea nil]XP_019166093.1 PREDICTED: villin-2-like [Ipomoea nil]